MGGRDWGSPALIPVLQASRQDRSGTVGPAARTFLGAEPGALRALASTALVTEEGEKAQGRAGVARGVGTEPPSQSLPPWGTGWDACPLPRPPTFMGSMLNFLRPTPNSFSFCARRLWTGACHLSRWTTRGPIHPPTPCRILPLLECRFPASGTGGGTRGRERNVESQPMGQHLEGPVGELIWGRVGGVPGSSFWVSHFLSGPQFAHL